MIRGKSPGNYMLCQKTEDTTLKYMLQCQKIEKNLYVPWFPAYPTCLVAALSARRLDFNEPQQSRGPSTPDPKCNFTSGCPKIIGSLVPPQKKAHQLIMLINHEITIISHRWIIYQMSSAPNQPLSSLLDHFCWISTWKALIWQVLSFLDPPHIKCSGCVTNIPLALKCRMTQASGMHIQAKRTNEVHAIHIYFLYHNI